MFATWIFLALTAVALIRLRITKPELPRQFRVWGYPFTPVVFGTVALAIAVNLWLLRPARSSIGIAIILLGLPFFYLWRKRAIAAPLSPSLRSVRVRELPYLRGMPYPVHCCVPPAGLRVSTTARGWRH